MKLLVVHFSIHNNSNFTFVDVIGEISAYGQLDDKAPDIKRHKIRLQLTNLEFVF